MNPNYRIAGALVAGIAIGGAGVQGLNAKAKPTAYVIGEVDVTNHDAFVKEYVPLAKALAVTRRLLLAARLQLSRASRQSELSSAWSRR